MLGQTQWEIQYSIYKWDDVCKILKKKKKMKILLFIGKYGLMYICRKLAQLQKKGYFKEDICYFCTKIHHHENMPISFWPPYTPLLYIKTWGLQGYTLLFPFLLKNIDCGYSLEPPHRCSSNEYPQCMFWAEIWKISVFFIWIFLVFGSEIFYIFK